MAPKRPEQPVDFVGLEIFGSFLGARTNGTTRSRRRRRRVATPLGTGLAGTLPTMAR